MQLPLSFEVTADNIEKGLRGVADSCPIALALEKLVGGNKHIFVDSDNIYIGDEVFNTAAEIRDLIEVLDSGGTVSPKAFTLTEDDRADDDDDEDDADDEDRDQDEDPESDGVPAGPRD